MGLFSKRKKNDDVIELTTYGQIDSPNNDVFPAGFFVEDWFMDDAEREARYPRHFRCQLSGGGYSTKFTAVFNRTGTNSYRIKLFNKYNRCYEIMDVKSLTPMTPLGTVLKEGGTYVLLKKGFDNALSERFDHDTYVISKVFDSLYIVDKETYDSHYRLSDMNYWSVSLISNCDDLAKGEWL